MVERHFAFFSQSDGTYIRDWKGPCPEMAPLPISQVVLTHDDKTRLFTEWATLVSKPQEGEIGLDVTHIGWPVGAFFYCTVDLNRPKPLLDWGPPRHYIEFKVATLEVVANLETHRPLSVSAVPGQAVLDITNTPWAKYHGRIFGRFVWREDDGRWGFEEMPGRCWTWSWRSLGHSLRTFGRKLAAPPEQLALPSAEIGSALNLVVPTAQKEFVYANRAS